MSLETFKQAVDSLKEYQGIVGIIGGEPTLHPEFEKIADYLREKRVGKQECLARGPIGDMQKYIRANLEYVNSSVVLLSTMPVSYYKNFEVINDTFKYQLLNDHRNACEHQALLMSRQELGVSDAEWKKKRDACWIQNTWSATITPKGAFFCEVAGALDMLFDGPGGWKVEEGWWRRKPEEFGDQLRWCEMCSACLDVPKRLSNDERDDVTPALLDKLREIGSPKIKNGQYVVRDPESFEEYKDDTYKNGNEYMQRGQYVRSASDNRNLYPKSLHYYSLTDLKEPLVMQKSMDWIGIGQTDDDRKTIEVITKQYVLNPGCLYVIDGNLLLFNALARSIRTFERLAIESIYKYYPEDKIVMFNSDDPLLPILGGQIDSIKSIDRNRTHLLVYGAGLLGREIVEYLDGIENVHFDIVVTEKKQNPEYIGSHRVYEIKEFADARQDVLVLLAASERKQDEMIEMLNNLGFDSYSRLMQNCFVK